MLCNLIKISASLPWPSPGSAVLSSNDDCSALENAAMTTLPLHNLQNPSIKASVSTESTRLGSAPTAAGAAASILKPLWQCWGNAGVLPASATEGWICYLALAVFFPSTLIIRALGFSLHWRLVLIAAVPAVIVLSLEALHLKTYRRPSTGLQFDRWSPNTRIIRYKLIGFHAILAAIAFFYYVTHEYSKDLYKLWFLMLRTIGPFAWAASLVYFVVVDGYQTEPAKKEDLYHNLGRLVLRQGTAVPVPPARWHNMAREYLVKVFFLPLMASFYSNSLQTFERLIGPLVDGMVHGTATFVQAFAFIYETIFFVDVVWATPGYMLSCKLFDTHVRSAEPTFLGWAVALSCYPPFVYSVLDAYCTYNSPQNAWGFYLKDAPRWLFWMWGSTILILSTIYSWATVAFGMRFSNLTNRGIITNGPYAFMRHPAYVCKNLSWWLIAVPWSTHEGYAMAFKRCVRLALINTVYYARAKTEERHLMRDPGYVDYFNALQRRYGLPPRATLTQQQQQQQQSQSQSQQQCLNGDNGEGLPLLPQAAEAREA